jgi:hypothetical protein
VDGASVLSSRLASCDGMGCTDTSPWTAVRLPLPGAALGSLELELGAGDCTTGALWLDDVRVRRGATPEPSATVAGAEVACP